MLDTPSQQGTPVAPTPPRSGFTAVNSGGFTAVNAGGFQAVNHIKKEREPERSMTPQRRTLDSPGASAKNTPDHKPSGLSISTLANGSITNPMKRQMSVDSVDSKKENGDTDASGGRRSKRLKKDAVPTVAGSHMFQRAIPLAARAPGEPPSWQPGEKCENCAKGNEVGKLLICDSCDHGYHMGCLDPPITHKPDYDWHCPRCLVGDGQFGFEDGGVYSLKQFQDKAANFKEGYFQNRLPFDPVLNCPRPVTEDDIEREFWRLVASLEETVEVEYGADIHSTTHGSGFPTSERNPRDPYSTDPWNLTIMPLHPDSLFRHIKTDISGMTVPWLYVGMIFSTFCWHNEDHYSYSANYQHFGSTKTWYGIPGEDAEKFENAMREAVPELFETQPDLLFQLVTLLTPEQLRKAGVRVYALDQRAGQFVITFPQAYHAGFNHGFNFNEAVNFAPQDWEPFGDAGVERLQQYRRQPCFSHDELLWTAAEGHATNGVTIATAKWLAPALERMRDREMAQRQAFLDKHNPDGHPCVITDKIEGAGPRCQIKFEIDDKDLPEEEVMCSYCKAYGYLSRLKCEKSGKILCMLHAGNHECCEMSEEERYAGKGHTLHYRRTREAIDQIYQKVQTKSQLPEVWEEKVSKLLDDSATPSLKSMRSLVVEGEKIPYELPSLPGLKDFVDKCTEWVDEATNYIVRKQQSRRKSEKGPRKGSKAAEAEEREKEHRKVDNMMRLLKQADEMGFDTPEIGQLRERAEAITKFQRDARQVLNNPSDKPTELFEELLEEGRSLNVDMPEIAELDKVVQMNKWTDRAGAAYKSPQTLQEVKALITDGEALGFGRHELLMRVFIDKRDEAEGWEAKAKEILSMESIHYVQLQALADQAQARNLPISEETKAEVDRILNRQREAQEEIKSLYERSKNPDPKMRPRYTEVRDAMEKLAELNSKPPGTLDLEKEQKRHEDWMRKGKKLFGKANAPLHILKTHMEYVLERNLHCFDYENDKPRSPAEPASREPTPIDKDEKDGAHSWEKPEFREVFCICRNTESGMMIECELCHEW
jgi:histone demethylase JARID1